MSRTAQLGAFILGALIIFAVMIFLIGEKQFLFSRTYRIKAPFDNVAGLDEGAPVRAGGVRVGTVEKIQLPRKPGDRVTIVMQLESSTREVIKKDSVAAVETEGLLGSKYVAISFGSPEGGQINDDDTIESRPSVDYADLAKKANEMMDSANVAIANMNEATGDLKSITGKIDNGQGTIGALVNDKSVYRNLNATTASLNDVAGEAKVGVTSFQENMEALKHNFFLKGFFKDRGYFNSSELTKNAVNNLPDRSPIKKFTVTGKMLFDKPDSAKLHETKQLDEAGKFLQKNPYGLVVVVGYSDPTSKKEDARTLSQARATVARKHLVEKFKIDEARIKTLGKVEDKQAEAGTAREGGRLEVVIYSGGGDSKTVNAKKDEPK